VAEAQWIARKIADLRILREEASVAEVGAEVLVVSQFTLYGQARKGRRPSWTDAAPGEVAEPLVDAVVAALRERGVRTETGAFGADMAVELTNDGPGTLVLDTPAPCSPSWCGRLLVLEHHRSSAPARRLAEWDLCVSRPSSGTSPPSRSTRW